MASGEVERLWSTIECAVEWGRAYERHRIASTHNDRCGAMADRNEAAAALSRALAVGDAPPQDPAEEVPHG